MTWRDWLAPLREANFRWYFLSRFVNTLDNLMAGVALAFAVLDITDSATALGRSARRSHDPDGGVPAVRRVIADRFPRVPIIRCQSRLRRDLAAIALLVIHAARQACPR
jgi:hypothetical protein